MHGLNAPKKVVLSGPDGNYQVTEEDAFLLFDTAGLTNNNLAVILKASPSHGAQFAACVIAGVGGSLVPSGTDNILTGQTVTNDLSLGSIWLVYSSDVGAWINMNAIVADNQ
jgi:hypothetical protein